MRNPRFCSGSSPTQPIKKIFIRAALNGKLVPNEDGNPRGGVEPADAGCGGQAGEARLPTGEPLPTRRDLRANDLARAQLAGRAHPRRHQRGPISGEHLLRET